MNIIPFLVGLLPSLTVGLFMFYWQRKQNRWDKQAEARAEARKQESLLSLEVTMATLKLVEATALAVQSKKVNGEMTDGMDSCYKAKNAYVKFLNEQAAENLKK